MLNEWVIRRPVVQPGPCCREGSTQRHTEKEQWAVLSLTHTGTLWAFKNTLLFLENKLTITLDFNVGWKS